MDFLDFSPPLHPTPDQQLDALQKGLGRAMQWAGSGVLSQEPLLNACLHAPEYGFEYRGKWLWNIICSTNLVRRLRRPVLAALKAVEREEDAAQLCELGYRYACNGDEAFTKLLFDIFEQQRFPDNPLLGMSKLLLLREEEAVHFIARQRGRRLVTHDWNSYDDEFVECAIDCFEKSDALEILLRSPEPDIHRFALAWQVRIKTPTDEETPRKGSIPLFSLASASDAFKVPLKDRGTDWWMWWWFDAKEDDLKILTEQLRSEQDAAVLVTILQAFWFLQNPPFEPRLIELCSHPDGNVRRWAIKAMAKFSNPIVRDFALQRIQDRALGKTVVTLFAKNFERGDEDRLLHQLELPVDINERVEMLNGLFTVLKENETADGARLGQIVYFHTPSENCRYSIAELLHQRQIAPTWLSEECCSDANPDCRKLGDSVCGHDEAEEQS